jgi:tetratricopeptide (TPR) repeat protein
LTISERLAAQHPDNAEWQRDLSVSYNRIGGALESQGNLAGALEDFRKALAITEHLAGQDPDDARWQRNLSVCQGRIGAVLESQGNLAGALEEYRKDLVITERLAAQDPDNAGWQSDFAFNLYETGEVHEQLYEFADAASLWRRELDVRSAMAARSENPSEADDDLASCHNQIGGALEAMEDFHGEIEAFREYLRLSQNVLERDPDNTTKQRNVAVGQASVARSELALGNLDRAQDLRAQAANTFRALLNSEDPGTQMDWAASLALGAEIAKASGDTLETAKLQDELATLDLGTEEPVGRFRKRFMPLIRQHLEAGRERRKNT